MVKKHLITFLKEEQSKYCRQILHKYYFIPIIFQQNFTEIIVNPDLIDTIVLPCSSQYLWYYWELSL